MKQEDKMTDFNTASDTVYSPLRSRFNRVGRRGYCTAGLPIFHKTVLCVVKFILLAVVLAGMTGCQKEQKSLEKVTIALGTQTLSAPVYVAHQMGFFKEEGFDITLQSHQFGKDALASVLKGSARFGTVAETPLMFAGLKGEKFSILATIADSNQYHKIVARKDRGIAGPKDLAGKRIGMKAGTTTEYFLDALLAYYGIPANRVDKVTINPEEMLTALAKGDIDAVVVWPPYTSNAQNLLGKNALMIENDKIYSLYWNIVTTREFAEANPKTVKRLLRALLRAERYISSNSAAVSAIMAKIVGDGSFTVVGNNFDLYQGQNLLLSMEDQARWAIKMRLTDLKEVPNFLPHFYTKGVKDVAPEALSSGLDTGKE